jgi:RNA polymerase sigma factor (sigma-70 family)
MGAGASLEAIEKLYETRFSQFVRTATAISGSAELGRDAVHDAFTSAVAGRRAYRGEGTLEAWLWRAVVTSALKLRQRRERAYGDEPPPSLWHDRMSDDFSTVRSAVARLPERQRLVLFLRYYADLDYQAIADTLKIRIGTVGAELHAAHGSLRIRLQEVVVNE